MTVTGETTGTLGTTAICSLGDGDDALSYRGHAIEALAEHASFEEVAYLLMRGCLPTAEELDAYRARLVSLREPPGPLMDVLWRVPDAGGPWALMDVLRTAFSFLGCLEPEGGPDDLLDVADRALALTPGLMVAWHKAHAEGARIDPVSDEPTTASHVLKLLGREMISDLDAQCLDVSLMLYAELAFNASTFACRVCASTRADFHACVTAGTATLRGPLHGGASVAVSDLLDRFEGPAAARAGVHAMLARRERLMGFGHAIFRKMDPRTPVLKRWAARLASDRGDDRLFAVATAVEDVARVEKGLFPNVDYYTSCCYHMIGLPVRLFGPLFIVARLTGWTAHVAEQRARGRLVHPVAAYDGPAPRPYVPLMDR